MKKILIYFGEFLIADVIFWVGLFLSQITMMMGPNYLGEIAVLIPWSFLPPLMVHTVAIAVNLKGKYWHGLIGSLLFAAIGIVSLFFAEPARALAPWMLKAPDFFMPFLGVGPVLTYNLLRERKGRTQGMR
jgi:hypothetical protein